MEWLYRTIVTVASLILLGMAIYFTYILVSPRFHTTDSVAATDDQRGVYYVIAIDMNADNKLDATTIVSGEDTLLMVKPDPKVIPVAATAKKPDYYIFNGAASLYQYDKNFDGNITRDDPIYNDLVVVSIIDRKTLKIMPISQSGIDAIHFNNDYLNLAKSNYDAPANMIIGTAVSGGVDHLVKIVPLPVSLFESK